MRASVSKFRNLFVGRSQLSRPVSAAWNNCLTTSTDSEFYLGQCHFGKLSEMEQEIRRLGFGGTVDLQALLMSICPCGVKPIDLVEKGRFVRVRDNCQFADTAIEQAMARDQDVFDDENCLFSRGVATE